jgi:hypothetical protein
MEVYNINVAIHVKGLISDSEKKTPTSKIIRIREQINYVQETRNLTDFIQLFFSKKNDDDI